MLARLMGKPPKTTPPAQQDPDLISKGKVISRSKVNGVNVIVLEEDEKLQKTREALAHNAQRRKQLEGEIADAQRQQREADTRAAASRARMDASQQRVAQLQQEDADDDAELARIEAEIAQIQKAQQDAQLASKI